MGAEKLPNVPSESQREQGPGTLKTINLFSHLLLLLTSFPKQRTWNAQAQWQWRTDKPLKGAEKLPNAPSESQREQRSGTLKTTNLFSHLLLLLTSFPKQRTWNAQAQWQWRTDKALKGAEKLPNAPSESQREQRSGTLKTTNLFSHLLLLLTSFPKQSHWMQLGPLSMRALSSENIDVPCKAL